MTTVDTSQTTTLCLLQTRSRLCLMVCLSVMMLVCSLIHSPVRSLSTATETLVSRPLWAASTSAPHTWHLTRSEVGVTGSMRLSAPTASQPRGYKPGRGQQQCWPPRSKRSQLWVEASSDNIPYRVRCGRGQTNYSHAWNVSKIVGEIVFSFL